MIKITGLYKSFITNAQEIAVLKDIHLEIGQGEILAIVGASGVGKSTLLHILGTLDRPTRGQVFYHGEDLFKKSDAELAILRNQRMGFVFQFHHLLPEFTALENVAMPALISGAARPEALRRAQTLLSDVGLEKRIHHKPGELSGGEQQRVAMARALLMKPELVLADEPTGNLDSHTGEEVFALLKDLNQRNNTSFVIVTHNEKLAVQADRIVKMVDGRIEIEKG